MSVLLDACALIGLARGDLPRAAAKAIARAPEAGVSSVSVWEIALKAAAGTLRLKDSPAHWFAELAERHDLREIPLDARTACAAAALPPLHRDPFDRVLVALAHSASLTIITSDRHIASYTGVTTIWD
jgi:PIN domain nuclease of toxin-antitoxin system